MKKNIPQKVTGLFEYTIKLKKDQVDYSPLLNRKEIVGFKEQKDRHITLVDDKASKKIEEALGKLSKNKKLEILNKLRNTIKDSKWQYTTKDIYKIEKKGYFEKTKDFEHRQSYIVLLDMQDIKTLFKAINKTLKIRIPTQVPHITLFTRGEHKNRGYQGIGIPSQTEFKKLNPRKLEHLL